ncbi:reticulocalbin-2 isoform X2 [Cylas formicarius]|uniref:reticulocalbin-2 isoform X2 n=1 Tax=Cylas formicarius TaxID=197179 RepID=UPI002958A450|nr:reticulocalbin-2 isoform X2 [Cylas formicarius]
MFETPLQKKYFLIYLFLIFLSNGDAGVMHSHMHENNKEREVDGAYIRRNKEHYNEAGEHHSEFDHEAILGSYKEAGEYDHLPPEEAKKKLKILLSKMDLTHDGLIDKKELKAWILRSFKMLSEEEAIERLEDADENNDGVVTWTEYVSDTYGAGEDAESINMHGESSDLITEDKELWKAADKNNDNLLDSQEWIAFSNPEEHPDMIPLILEQTLKSKDKDGDKVITFQEYIAERGNDLSKEALQAEKVKFDEYDKDGDGKLFGSEILSWIVPTK